MRPAAILAVTVPLLASLSATLPSSSQAGGGDIYYMGLLQHPLGAATIAVTPTFPPHLIVANIGSSGQDGVAVEWPQGAKGWGFLLDSSSDLPGTGSSQTITLSRAAGTDGGMVHRVRNSDGSQTLTPDFSSVGVPTVWTVLIDAAGNVVKRVRQPFVHAKEWSASTPKLASARCAAESPSYRWIHMHYDNLVEVEDGSGEPNTICQDIRIICDTGDPVTDLTATELKWATPSGAPSGSVTVHEQGIVPPCAGCPNGPDDTGEMVALGETHFALGGGGGGSGSAVELENLGSSGQDGVRIIGEIGCCHNDEIGVSISDMELTSPPDPGMVVLDTHGTAGGVLDQPVGHLICTVEGTEWSFVPDFSPIGATGYRVLLYMDGTPVADVTNPMDGVRKWGDGHITLMKAYDDGSEEYRIVCITHPCPGSPITMNGTMYIANEIHLQPFGGSLLTVDNISSMSLASSGGRSITINGVSFRSTAPVVGVDRPAAATELAAARLAPNPAFGPVDLAFALPQAGRATVSVIDVAGRRVRGLAEGHFTAGAHELRWDGRDDAGGAAPAGLYFLRIESGAFTQVARMTRLR